MKSTEDSAACPEPGPQARGSTAPQVSRSRRGGLVHPGGKEGAELRRCRGARPPGAPGQGASTAAAEATLRRQRDTRVPADGQPPRFLQPLSKKSRKSPAAGSSLFSFFFFFLRAHEMLLVLASCGV